MNCEHKGVIVPVEYRPFVFVPKVVLNPNQQPEVRMVLAAVLCRDCNTVVPLSFTPGEGGKDGISKPD